MLYVLMLNKSMLWEMWKGARWVRISIQKPTYFQYTYRTFSYYNFSNRILYNIKIYNKDFMLITFIYIKQTVKYIHVIPISPDIG